MLYTFSNRIKHMKHKEAEIIDEVQLKVTVRTLVDNNITGAVILARLYRMLEDQEAVSTKDILSQSVEDIKKLYRPVSPRGLTPVLRRLEKSKLVESITPYGRKRPTYWRLTEIGKKVAERVAQELGI